MQRTDFRYSPCPIARGLQRVGEWWNILILRDAFVGLTRFDDFQKSLGIAPNILTRRLNALTDEGLLERRAYSERPPRYEYVLTATGRDFWPVLVAFTAWGNQHFAPEGASVVLNERASGKPVAPVLVDRASGMPVSEATHAFAPGPSAPAAVHRHYAFAAARAARPELPLSYARHMQAEQQPAKASQEGEER